MITSSLPLDIVRKNNLRALTDEHGTGNVSRAAGYPTASFISQMISPLSEKRITEKTARKIEKAMMLPPYWMDQERDAFCKPVGLPIAVVRSGEAPETMGELPKPAKNSMFESHSIDEDHFTQCAYILSSTAVNHCVKLPREKFSTIVKMLMSNPDRSDFALQALAENLIALAK